MERTTPRTGPPLARRPTTLVLAGLAMLTSCALSRDTSLPPVAGIAPGDTSIERVIFLLGDAGESPPEGSPLFTHLRGEVEEWSAALAADSAVTVVFLGDNVYPNGVHAPGHSDRGRDSIRLSNQIDLVRGPQALLHHATGLFVAGNHDWGGDTGPEGAARLLNEEALIQAAASAGAAVDLLPAALQPGPEVLDLGPHVKLVALDTQWWLSNADTPQSAEVLQDVIAEVQDAQTQTILFATHHPLVSGGPHGGNVPFWPTFGLKKIRSLAGSSSQDLSSRPYREMIAEFKEAFASTSASLIYAAGHEHGLQVIEGRGSDDPEWMLVSGSGSKKSTIRDTRGTRFRSSAAGFMRLLVERDGTVRVEVVAETDAGFETVFVQPISPQSGTD
jgi:hypothetical protein